MAQEGSWGQNICSTRNGSHHFKKKKLDDSKTKEGVKCLLYDARSNPAHDVQAEMNLKKALQNINPQMGLSVMAKDDCTVTSCVETKFGEAKVAHFAATS